MTVAPDIYISEVALGNFKRFKFYGEFGYFALAESLACFD